MVTDRVLGDRSPWSMFVMLWRALLVCLVGTAVAEVVPWWTRAVYYRILVDSFKDGDGDGLGDLKGVIKQLSYVRAIGADAVILSPMSARSTDCSSPGVVDFTVIDPRFGSLEAFNNLVEKAKKLELKVLVSLPLQTISSESDWFKSSADRVNGFEDTVIWEPGDADTPPPVATGVDAWVWHEPRKAYWGSSNGEVLLNLCSESVAAALSAAQCAWIRRRVSGMLLNPDFPKEQKCGEQLLKKLAADAVSCARSAGFEPPVVLVETSLQPSSAAMYYEAGGLGPHGVLSRALTSSTRSAAELGIAIHSELLTAPQEDMPAWFTSSTNQSRIATRYGSDMVDAINLLALVLPGSAVIQQGDELGAADTILEWATNSKCWPNLPVAASAPFPWDDTVNAGFSSGEPWLPLAPNYRYANAKTEYASAESHVGVVRVAAALRKSPAFGPHVEINRINGALAVLRWGAAGSLLLISNLARETTEVQLTKIPGLPTEVTVAASSGGSRFSVASHLSVDRSVKLGPGETVLLLGGPRHCGGPGPVDKIASKLSEGWQKVNKYFSSK